MNSRDLLHRFDGQPPAQQFTYPPCSPSCYPRPRILERYFFRKAYWFWLQVTEKTAFPRWLAFTNVLVIFAVLKGVSLLLPVSAFRLGFTNGLMSESMILWFAILGNRETVIEDCETLVAMLEDTAALDTKIAATQEEIDTVVEMNKALIREHAVTGVPQEEFDQKATAYDERFRKADAKLNRLKAEKQDRLMRVCSVKKYVENLRGQAGPIDVWDEQAWCLLVTQVTVHADGSAEFLFRGENRVTVK